MNMRTRAQLDKSLILFAGALLLLPINPKISSAAVVQINLKKALSLALTNNKELKAVEHTLEQADADIVRVRSEFGPKIDATLGVGPITETTGNALQSIENTSKWGVIFLGSLELVQPIFTWGRRDDYMRAAKNGKIVKEEDLRKKRADVRYQVKEAYYGTLYTMSLLEFIEGAENDMRRVRREMGKKTTKEDRYRFDIIEGQLGIKKADVENSLALAKAGLGLRVGMDQDQMVVPEEEWIEAEERDLKPLNFYLDLSRKEKPEFRQLAAGIIAKRSLGAAEKKAFYPAFAILGRYSFAHTKSREEQQSVFANDPYNRDNFVIGVGLKWNFQWGLPFAKWKKYMAEASELEAKQAYAKNGLLVLVRKAYWEVEAAEKRVVAARKAYKAGKKWLSRHMIGLTAGLGNSKKIVEVYQAKALARKDMFEAMYKQHMAWAGLSRVVGIEVDPILQ